MNSTTRISFSTAILVVAPLLQSSIGPDNFMLSSIWLVAALFSAAEIARGWLADKNRYVRLGASLGAALVVGGLAWPWFWKSAKRYYRGDEFSLLTHLPDPKQIGTDKLDLRYFLINPNKRYVLVQEVRAHLLTLTDFANDAAYDTQFCNMPGLNFLDSPGFLVANSGEKALHYEMKKPARTSASGSSLNDPPPLEDDHKVLAARYLPSAITLGDKDLKPPQPFPVDPEHTVAVSASFDLDPVDWSKRNVAVICAGVKLLDQDGRTENVVCPAYIVARMDEKGKQMGVMGAPAGVRPFSIWSTSADSACTGRRQRRGARLRVSVLAGHPGHSRVAVGGIADRDGKCHRIWFQSQKAAERVIAELHRTHGMRRGDTMVIEAATDDADDLASYITLARPCLPRCRQRGRQRSAALAAA
jgi:hypothetical protein